MTSPNPGTTVPTGISLGPGSGGYRPTYASSKGDYLASRNVYNADSPQLHRIRASLALSPTQLRHWAWVGTSIFDGANGNGNQQDSEQAVPAQLAKTLVAFNIGIVDGGFGTRPASNIGGVALPSEWAVTGAFNTSTAPYFFTSNGGTATFTAPRTVTAVAPCYFDAVATTTPWTINGVAQTPIPAGSTNTWKRLASPGGVAAGQTVQFAPAAGNSFFIHDVQGLNATGIVMHNLCMGGGRASGGSNLVNWTAALTTGTLPGVRTAAMQGLTVDVVVIELGINDVLNAVTPANIIAGINTILGYAAWSAAAVILAATWRNPTVTDAAWNAYLFALYQLADTLNCPLWDGNDRVQGQPTAQADGMLGPDNLHGNYSVYGAFGKAMADWLVS